MHFGKRAMKSPFVSGLLALLAATYLRLVNATTRWQRIMPPATRQIFEQRKAAVACFWHGRMLVMRPAWQDHPRRFHMLISGHRDGAFIARALRRLGHSVITGSGTSPRYGGREALKQMGEVVARGEVVGVTPDGPRGPLMRAKGGAVMVAQTTGAPLIAVTGAVRRGPYLRSWDRFIVPWPFNRGVLLYGEPIYLPPDARLDALEAARRRLEEEMNRLCAEADRLCGRPPVLPGSDPGRRPKSRKKSRRPLSAAS